MSIKSSINILRGFDWVLLAATLFLVLLGLTVIYSTSLGDTGLNRFDKQLIALSLGVGVIFILSVIDYRRLGGTSWMWYLISVLLLISVLVFGTTIRGTTGWFILGPFSFQPVEVVKVVMVIVLAYYLSRVSRPDWRTWLISFLIIAPIIVLLLLQPDFGPLLIIVFLWFMLNALRGLNKRGWLVVISTVVIFGSAAWFGVLPDVQKERIMTFMNPQRDPTGSGFQVTQSIIAVGSGGLVGRGLGEGVQSQLHFLPEASTDFVFASMLEQLGFVGFLLLLAGIAIFFWRIVRMINRARDNYTLYVLVGFGMLVFIQMVINIAMNIGLSPIIGLPLPYVSYGGSALIGSLMVVGIIESIVIRQRL